VKRRITASKRWLILLSLAGAVLVLMLGTGIGSVFVAPGDILAILARHLFGTPLPQGISGITDSLVWRMRLPRVLLAFVVGAGLGASGTVMQSVLRNPLASSYTLGVSAGAALGAGIVMVTGFTLPLLGAFTLPLVGLISGMVTVFLAEGFASRMDRGFSNNTIILAGMVFALFINAMLTLLASVNKEHMQRIALWQMGSFALKEWSHIGILAPVTLAGILWLRLQARELDMIVFGEEQAQTMGVSVRRVKWLLLGVSAALTGSAVAFSGIIGFIDLIAPHVTRKLFGASHRLVVPLSALFGGTFMVVADLLARTLVSPGELQVGTVTAVIGAPFFAWVYFRRSRKGGAA
jgi:iron complex transport system permease protein